MTDLRKAAMDAVEHWDNIGYLDTRPTSYVLMNTLREALQVEPELVGEIHDCDHMHMAIWTNGTPDVGTKLYTTPPSIDALIAEIDALEYGQIIYADQLNPILDKYRSTK